MKKIGFSPYIRVDGNSTPIAPFTINNSEERFVSFKPKNKMTKHELALIQNDVPRDIDFPPVFVPDNIAEFKKIFFEIISLYQAKKYNYEILYKAKMPELLDYILRHFENRKQMVYYRNLRLNYAKDKLVQTDISIIKLSQILPIFIQQIF